MIARTLAGFVFSLAWLMSAPAWSLAADTYVVDPAHTSVVFSVSHTGLSFTYGFFRKTAGAYILDKTNPANCRFQFSIDTDSLDTNHADRDKHLRSAEFFNVQEFPAITFESTKCSLMSSQEGGVLYQVTGNLTIHGVTRQVTIPLRMLGEGRGPHGDQRSGFLCQTDIKRSDFGMTGWLDSVGDAVGITVSFEGVLRETAGAATRPR
jgi:polyisoprenoid-binding protein YceI